MSISELEQTQAVAAADGGDALHVVKRDGRTLRFDDRRIATALAKAFTAVNGEWTAAQEQTVDALVARIDAELAERFTDTVKIYEIQSVVEHELLEAGEYDVARAYIDYRVERDISRSKAMDLNHSITRLMSKDSAVVHENANKDADVYNTQRDLTAGMVGKAIGLRMLP